MKFFDKKILPLVIMLSLPNIALARPSMSDVYESDGGFWLFVVGYAIYMAAKKFGIFGAVITTGLLGWLIYTYPTIITIIEGLLGLIMLIGFIGFLIEKIFR